MTDWKHTRAFYGCMLFLVLTGCGKTENEPDMQRSMTEVTTQEITMTTQDAISQEEIVTIEESILSEETQSNQVDYDLTQMGSDMVYATVYQMMVNPTMYENKTVKVSGNYYGGWYEPTKQYYYYVIIEDAMACCSQGLEFIWEDGSHVYPDEYPEDGSKVEVTGVLETYKEEGDQTIYCRLKNSELVIQ